MAVNTYRNRPISPHLTIYNAQWSSVGSIFHRISGTLLVLSFFIPLYVLKLLSLFGSYSQVYTLSFTLGSASFFVLSTIFFFVLLSYFYHLCNGCRHLVWDLGGFLQITKVERSGKAIMFLAFLLSTVSTACWFSYN
uniref:Succinate dehydrogenase cytochrome B560 subunit n=1 Tax=Cavernulicola chilensis TaxID=3028028 RepID=A0A7H0WB86_9RHOD|nr:succinate dehydrogenase cytochrome B560 subunit [Cavernulicola chilensis]QNR39815.1 succinate dehydrogenase cytochrome B560 subunit [Cavernulicola chilensis]